MSADLDSRSPPLGYPCGLPAPASPTPAGLSAAQLSGLAVAARPASARSGRSSNQAIRARRSAIPIRPLVGGDAVGLRFFSASAPCGRRGSHLWRVGTRLPALTSPSGTGFRLEPVAHTANVDDPLLAELLAQVPDVDVHDVRAGVEVVAPDAAQELLAAENVARILEEDLGE